MVSDISHSHRADAFLPTATPLIHRKAMPLAQPAASTAKTPAAASQSSGRVSYPSASVAKVSAAASAVPTANLASAAAPTANPSKRSDHPVASPPKARKKARKPSPDTSESEEVEQDINGDTPPAEDDEDDDEDKSQTIPEAVATRARAVKLSAEEKRLRFAQKYAQLTPEETLGTYVSLRPLLHAMYLHMHPKAHSCRSVPLKTVFLLLSSLAAAVKLTWHSSVYGHFQEAVLVRVGDKDMYEFRCNEYVPSPSR